MLRTTRVLRRTCMQGGIRRYLHEDSRGDFLGFNGTKGQGADLRFGMDMTRAPGYELAADEDPPLVGNQKLADFAARHARLTAGQAGLAEGYLWVGSVIYPSNHSHDSDIEFAWEREVDEAPVASDFDNTDVSVSTTEDEKQSDETLQAQRRYSGGQARRIRKERERNALKKANKRLRRRTGPTRKPHNDIPDEDDS